MGKDLKGKELGVGITQQKNGLYNAGFVDKLGIRRVKRFKKLQECRKWLDQARYTDEHSNITEANTMMVDAFFEYWISIKEKTVRPNTVRNYRERYHQNISKVIGKMLLVEVGHIHCQAIFTIMADEGYKTSTMYQTRIALYNMLEFAKENDIITSNPCKRSVRSDIGKPSEEKRALKINEQKKFLEYARDQSYENQYKFILQTGLRTGELVGLKWSDIDFEKRALKISRSMEYRHSTKEWRVGPPKSKSGYRVIPLTDEAIRILKDQKLKNSTIKVIPMEWREFVFLCRKGTPIKNSTYDTGLYKICGKASIRPFSMHILRHMFATRCIEAGMKPKTLQKILGHSNIGITMNLYVTTTEDEKQKEIELVADALMVM